MSIIIDIDKKLKKLNNDDVNIRSILDNLSNTVYGKNINLCIGHSSNIIVSKLKNIEIIVLIPKNYNKTLSTNRDMRYIISILDHLKNKGIDAKINMC
jgi:beta-lactamase regulating signal transducer with metallopeptidase domain